MLTAWNSQMMVSPRERREYEVSNWMVHFSATREALLEIARELGDR